MVDRGLISGSVLPVVPVFLFSFFQEFFPFFYVFQVGDATRSTGMWIFFILFSFSRRSSSFSPPLFVVFSRNTFPSRTSPPGWWNSPSKLNGEVVLLPTTEFPSQPVDFAFFETRKLPRSLFSPSLRHLPQYARTTTFFLEMEWRPGATFPSPNSITA